MTRLDTTTASVCVGASNRWRSWAAKLEAVEPPEHLGDPDLTENARAVLERRYLRKDPETGVVVETPRQCFWRVATHIAKAELGFKNGKAETALAIAEEYYGLMARRQFMPNSPTLMNAGREMGMLSACFVLPVEDSIDGIFESVKATALMSVVQLPELMRMTDIAARAVRMPFTFYFGASLVYLAITIVSLQVLGKAEAWANRGIRRA